MMTREEKLTAISKTLQPGEELELMATHYWWKSKPGGLGDGHDVYRVTSDGWEYVRWKRHEKGDSSNFQRTFDERVANPQKQAEKDK